MATPACCFSPNEFPCRYQNPFSVTKRLVSHSLLQLGLQFPNDVYSVLFTRKIIFDGKDESKLNEVIAL